MAEKKLKATNLWPLSLADTSEAMLASLTDDEFHVLRTLFYKREIARGNSRRRARAVVRLLIKKRNADSYNGASAINPSFFKFRSSRLLSAIYPQREKHWVPIRKRKRKDVQQLSIENFSFLDEPIKTMSCLHEIIRLECSAFGARVHFDDPYVKDVGPYLILGLMRKDMTHFMSGGRMQASIKRVLKAVSLDDFLSMDVQLSQTSSDVWPFPVRHWIHTEDVATEIALNPSLREKVSDELADTINDWLKQLSTETQLTDYGKAWLKSLVGETLCNAERHSKSYGKGSWSVAGFMAKRSVEGQDELLCHLSFVSLGRSVSESLNDGTPRIKDELETYFRKHRRSKFRKEELSTLYAVQDGVTRTRTDEVKGGFGFMEIITMANNLGLRASRDEHTPRITIVSGDSCLMFKDQYHDGHEDPKSGKRTQYLNPTNSIDSLPDSDYLFRLPHSLPGTLISVRFALSESSLVS